MMQLYAKLLKVDEERRTIIGRAVDETPDRSGEAFDYSTSKAHFEQWSKESLEASDGKSHGNLRAMHGKVAAGKLLGLQFDDTAKAIDVEAQVVDDAEWKKVLEGVYTGFSIGGSYLKKWEDPKIKKGDGKPITRYTAAPSELSLVDRPCVPSARFFSIQKADGASQEAEFKSVLTDEQIEAAAREMAKADGQEPDTIDTTDGKNEPVWKGFISAAIEKLQEEPAQASGNEAEKVAAPSGTTTSEASPSSDGPNGAAPTTKYEVEGSDDEVGKLATIMHDEKLAMKDVLAFVDSGLAVRKADAEMAEILAKEDAGTLKKGMYLVGRLASVVESLDSIRQSIGYEEAAEKDVSSKLPAKSASLLAAATDLLREMVMEESAEMLAADVQSPVGAVMALGHFGDLKKIGARNNSADSSRIQKVHDLAVELGCACGAKEAADGIGDLAKGVTQEALNKAVNAALAEALGPLQKANADLMEKVSKMEAQPGPARGVLRAVSKSGDVIDASAEKSVQPVVTNDGQQNEVATLIKAAHASGGVPLGLRSDGSSILNKQQ